MNWRTRASWRDRVRSRPGSISRAKAVSKPQKEIQQLKTKLALGGGGGAAADDDKIQIGESTLIAREMTDVDPESLRTLADTLKSRLKSGIVVLAAAMPEGKVSLIVTVTPDLAKKAPAGQLVKQLAPIVGGGGGGRPTLPRPAARTPQNYRIVGGCPERGHAPSGLMPDKAEFCSTAAADRKLPIR